MALLYNDHEWHIAAQNCTYCGMTRAQLSYHVEEMCVRPPVNKL